MMSPFGEMEDLARSLENRPVSNLAVLVDATWRGIGQILFVNSPAAGVVIWIGMLISEWDTAFYGLLGSITSTVGAVMLGAPEGDIRKGIHGFNGALVGCAVAAYDTGSAGSAGAGGIGESIMATLFFGLFAAVLAINISKLTGDLPMLSLPFNLGMLWFLGGALQYAHMGVGEGLEPQLTVEVVQTCFRSSAEGACSDNVWLWEAFTATFRGMAAVFFGTSVLAGAVMYAGVALCSPRCAALCAAGSFIGVVVGSVLGVDGNQLHDGIWSFNPLLTCAAVGCGNFCRPTKRVTALAGVSAIFVTMLFGTVAALLSPAGMPALSIPFCIATLAFLNLHTATDMVELHDGPAVAYESVTQRDAPFAEATGSNDIL